VARAKKGRACTPPLCECGFVSFWLLVALGRFCERPQREKKRGKKGWLTAGTGSAVFWARSRYWRSTLAPAQLCCARRFAARRAQSQSRLAEPSAMGPSACDCLAGLGSGFWLPVASIFFVILFFLRTSCSPAPHVIGQICSFYRFKPFTPPQVLPAEDRYVFSTSFPLTLGRLMVYLPPLALRAVPPHRLLHERLDGLTWFSAAYPVIYH
jgi:hypothetical protein